MATISKSFTATGSGATLYVRLGESFTYDVSGTFVGTVVLERSGDGGLTWTTINSATTTANGTVVVDGIRDQRVLVRYRCSDFTSGTIVTAIADVSTTVAQSFRDLNDVEQLQIVEGGIQVPGTAIITGAATITGALTQTGAVAMGSTLAVTGAINASAAINEAHGADIVAAGTINLTTATGNVVDVTGTTTITAVTLAEGYRRIVRFTGILTLTHGASLVLPGAANITTAAGDYAEFVGYAAGVVRCSRYVVAASAGVTLAGTQTLTNKTLTAPVIASVVSGGLTVTIPAATDTLVGKATTDTLTNKTLTAPVIASVVSGGLTVTIPAATDTLVGKATTDTLTNKTLTAPTINSPVMSRPSQVRVATQGFKVGATVGWVVAFAANTNLQTIPNLITAGTLVLPLSNLKVGETITAFAILGNILSAGNVATLDINLRKQVAASGSITDSSIATLTQISVTANTLLDGTGIALKSGLTQVVAANESYYLLITATTAATTSMSVTGCPITVTEV